MTKPDDEFPSVSAIVFVRAVAQSVILNIFIVFFATSQTCLDRRKPLIATFYLPWVGTIRKVNSFTATLEEVEQVVPEDSVAPPNR